MVDQLPKRAAAPPAVGRVKGSLFARLVKALRYRRDDVEPLLEPLLEKYLDCRVLDSSWFPEEDYFELMRVLISLLPDPGMDVWEWAGRDAARHVFPEIYRSMIRSGDPSGSLHAFAFLWKLRHDTGEMSVAPAGAGRATVELYGYALTHDEMMRAIQGTLWQTLHQAGAREIEIERHFDAERHTCVWQVRWQASSWEPARR